MVNSKYKEALQDLTKYLKENRPKIKVQSKRIEKIGLKSSDIFKPWKEKFDKIRASSQCHYHSNLNNNKKGHNHSNYVIQNFDKYVLDDTSFDIKSWKKKANQSNKIQNDLRVSK